MLDFKESGRISHYYLRETTQYQAIRLGGLCQHAVTPSRKDILRILPILSASPLKVRSKH